MKEYDHCYEMLNVIENEKDAKRKIELLKHYGSTSPLSHLLALNFDQTIRLDLPSGMAPFNRDETTHKDFMGRLVANIKRLKVCFVGSNYQKFIKERTFIQICESIPVKEAEVLCFVKDKALEELYPSITDELVASVFPSYVRKDPSYKQPTIEDKEHAGV